jgi:predicted transcriptional regulator
MIQLINLLSSPRILEVLTELLTPKTREELKSRIPTSTSSLSQVLNRTISLNLIARHDETFRILPKGELVLRIYETIAGYEKFLNKFDDYVNIYILENIPEHLSPRFYELKDFVVVESDECFRPHREFMEALSNSKEICGYSTVLFPEYIESFLKFAEEGRRIELVVNRDVLRQILENYKIELEKGLEYKNVEFYFSQKDYKFSFVVTDTFFSISFYLKTGFFDYKRDFLCESKDSIRWGMDLFNHVKANSLKIDTKGVKEMIRHL